MKVITVDSCILCPYQNYDWQSGYRCEKLCRILKNPNVMPEDCPLEGNITNSEVKTNIEPFDFKHITIMATGGRTDFMEPFIPNIKYQSDKFAVIEVSTVLKNGYLGVIGGNEFSLCSNENSTLHGERLVGYNFCVVQLGLPEGWRIYDANTIGRYTIAVYVEKLPVKETNEVS